MIAQIPDRHFVHVFTVSRVRQRRRVRGTPGIPSGVEAVPWLADPRPVTRAISQCLPFYPRCTCPFSGHTRLSSGKAKDVMHKIAPPDPCAANMTRRRLALDPRQGRQNRPPHPGDAHLTQPTSTARDRPAGNLLACGCQLRRGRARRVHAECVGLPQILAAGDERDDAEPKDGQANGVASGPCDGRGRCGGAGPGKPAGRDAGVSADADVS